jgi:hypothetical protein
MKDWFIYLKYFLHIFNLFFLCKTYYYIYIFRIIYIIYRSNYNLIIQTIVITV